jgi:hypothetical protein
MKILLRVLFPLLLLTILSCESKVETPPKNNSDQQQNYTPPPPPVIQRQENINPQTAKEILAIVYENLEATKVENKERVMATIHKDSPQYRSTVQGLDFVFANFDLDLMLEKAEVIQASDTDAQVYYSQITRSVRGQGFQNKKDEGIHHLKKQDGQWKIFRTEYLSTTPVN